MEKLLERLKKLETKVATAKAQKTVRQQQLAEIAPQKKALETEVKEKFNCSIKDLPELQKKLQKDLLEVVDKLESKLEPVVEETND